MKQVVLIIVGLFFSAAASATTWNVDGILSGVDGGFGYSSLHDASGYNVMSGGILANINDASGTYDDSTGIADFLFTLSNGDYLSLYGILNFDATGWLSGDSTLGYSGLDNLYSSDGISATGDFGYMPAKVCCRGSYAPNSFKATGYGDLHYMTMWGADGFNLASGSYYDSPSSVGMDFRLELSAVPIPAALYLFGSALIGLIGFQRRKV